MLQKELEQKICQYPDPYLDRSLGETQAVKRVVVHDHAVEIDLEFGYPFQGIRDKLFADVTAYLQPYLGSRSLSLRLLTRIDAHAGRKGISGHKAIKNIVAVASGKGGVGKSTIAVNVALSLAAEGARVGLLDADIYGPSQPTMLGVGDERPVLTDKVFTPLAHHGIQSMSMGYLIGPDTPMVWRGPMIGKALEQLLFDTAWDDLDYLLIDLPPGTGDIQLTMCQKMPISGAVIVTTPQDLALADVTRACEAFKKLDVSILGVVENMSSYVCPNCDHEAPLFGAGGGAKLAQQYELALIGRVPLDVDLRTMTDGGQPPPIAAKDGKLAHLFGEMARRIAAKLSLEPKDYSRKFPKIVVK